MLQAWHTVDNLTLAGYMMERHWRKYWIVAQSLGQDDARYRRFNGAVVYAPANLPTGSEAVTHVILEKPGEYATTLDVPTRLLAVWHKHKAEHRHCYCKREYTGERHENA